jgi:hypothetical protein
MHQATINLLSEHIGISSLSVPSLAGDTRFNREIVFERIELSERAFRSSNLEKGVVLYIHKTETRTASSHFAVDDAVNILWAQHCLTECDKGHDTCAPLPDIKQNLPAQMYLIDLQDQRLVQASSASVYVALSYVWGSGSTQFKDSECSRHQLLRMHQAGFFTPDGMKFPQTVLDAM